MLIQLGTNEESSHLNIHPMNIHLWTNIEWYILHVNGGTTSVNRPGNFNYCTILTPQQDTRAGTCGHTWPDLWFLLQPPWFPEWFSIVRRGLDKKRAGHLSVACSIFLFSPRGFKRRKAGDSHLVVLNNTRWQTCAWRLGWQHLMFSVVAIQGKQQAVITWMVYTNKLYFVFQFVSNQHGQHWTYLN